VRESDSFANAGIGGRTPTGATDEAAFERFHEQSSYALLHKQTELFPIPSDPFGQALQLSGFMFHLVGSAQAWLPRLLPLP
jgi:hypothetical protein